LTSILGDREPSRLVVEDDEDGIGRASPFSVGGRSGSGARIGALLALAALVLVGVGVVAAERPSPLRESTNTPSPTFARFDSGTPLPTEAEAWGGIWSQSKGVTVLRPTWLPRDEFQIQARVATLGDFFNYSFLYTELHSVVGTTVWSIEFFADSLEFPTQGFQEFGGAAEDVKIRGHTAELFGNGSPGWTLVWNEGNHRYAITAFAVTRDDLFRIAGSLAQVIDDTGRVSTRST
jgi:hypothetical protein